MINNTFVNCTKAHNAYSSRDITWINNVVLHDNLSEVASNQYSAIQLDVMGKQCSNSGSVQYRFLHRVPYNKPPYTKYPHLANILEDNPCSAKYWNLSGNVFCDISKSHFGDSPLIGGNFDRKSFGIDAGNTNSSSCAHYHQRH